MNRQELQQLLDAHLLGVSAYDFGKLCRHIQTKLGEWFDNSQGLYGVRYYQYSITITYKGRGFVSFEIKRKKDDEHFYIVKQVIIGESFVDTDTSIKLINEQLDKENCDEWRMYYGDTNKQELVDAMKLLKAKYPQKKLCDIKDMLYYLYHSFWNIEHESEK